MRARPYNAHEVPRWTRQPQRGFHPHTGEVGMKQRQRSAVGHHHHDAVAQPYGNDATDCP